MTIGIGTAISKNGVKIRLTEERWFHIIYSHREIDPSDFPIILEVIEDPDLILTGDREEVLATKKKPGRKDWFVIVYKEVNKNDGFILTAYITTDVRWLLKREVIWSKKS